MKHDLHAAVLEIGAALKRPESLSTRWRDRALHPELAPPPAVFPVLLLTAFLGLFAYGLSMGLHGGASLMLDKAIRLPISAGIAWTITIPGFYLVNAAFGGKLDASTTALTALAAAAFGALAMLASVPVNWFFGLALPYAPIRFLVNLVIFGGVGISMFDTWLRAVRAAEPTRGAFLPIVWLLMLGIIGLELNVLLGVLP